MTDLFNLKGKTCVVTGAASGLGERFAEALAEHGGNVICCARRRDRIEAVAKRINADGGRCRSSGLTENWVKRTSTYLYYQGPVSSKGPGLRSGQSHAHAPQDDHCGSDYLYRQCAGVLRLFYLYIQ